MKRRMVCILLICSLLISGVGFSGNGRKTVAAETESSIKAGDIVEYEGKGFSVTYEVTALWNCSYNVNVTITNTSESTIHNWALLYHLDDNKITNIWNAKIAKEEYGVYLIDNNDWNMDIDVNSSVQFGYTATYQDTIAIMPSVFCLTSCEYEVDAEDYDVIYDVQSNDGGVLAANVKIKNLTDSCMEDWKFTFQYKNQIQSIWSGEEIARNTKENEFEYTVRNPGWSQKIDAKSDVSFGFLAGTDRLEADIEPISLRCYSNAINYECDSDNDQLSDYAEIIEGTNPYCDDTDRDGLLDGYEYFYTNTNPLLYDTDVNEICDADEDFDKDLLNNLEEMINGTNPNNADSDEDGLPDGQEIKKYKTNPLLEDTDADGLLDGEEIELGTNPLLEDSDGDGVPDSEKMIQQSLEGELDGINGNVIQSVEISAESNGFISNNMEIEDIYNSDTLVSNVVGIVGDPFEVFVDSEITAKNIKMKVSYDKNRLSDNKEQLAILYYNEEIDEFQYVEDVHNDKELGSLSCSINESGKYLVVNKSEWENAWLENIEYQSHADEASGEDAQVDTDGDGLLDSYEINGMKISNGTIIYTNPLVADTDGDGLSDYDEVGDMQTKQFLNRNITWFSIKSYPDNEDSDIDELSDAEDDCAFEMFTDMENESVQTDLRRRAAKGKKIGKFKVSSINLYKNHSLTCDAVEANLKKALGEYNSNKKVNSQKVKKYMNNVKKAILKYQLFLVNATDNLKHYIGNTGVEKKANMKAFYSISEYKKCKKKNLLKLIKTANKYSKKKKKASYYMYSNPKFQFNGGCYNDKSLLETLSHLDVAFSVGDINAAMNVKISKKDKTYKAEVDYYLIDCYDWDKSNDARMGGINASELYYLSTVGKAKPYRYRGYESFSITWQQGSKKYSIIPQPKPTPNIKEK